MCTLTHGLYPVLPTTHPVSILLRAGPHALLHTHRIHTVWSAPCAPHMAKACSLKHPYQPALAAQDQQPRW